MVRTGFGADRRGGSGVRGRLHLVYVPDARQRAGGCRVARRCRGPFCCRCHPSAAGQPHHRRRGSGDAGRLPDAVGEPCDGASIHLSRSPSRTIRRSSRHARPSGAFRPRPARCARWVPTTRASRGVLRRPFHRQRPGHRDRGPIRCGCATRTSPARRGGSCRAARCDAFHDRPGRTEAIAGSPGSTGQRNRHPASARIRAE